MELVKTLGLPFDEGLENAADLPHTISLAVTYRSRINSLYELPKDKRPPRDLWDKPFRLGEFLDSVFEDKSSSKSKSYVEYDSEEVE